MIKNDLVFLGGVSARIKPGLQCCNWHTVVNTSVW